MGVLVPGKSWTITLMPYAVFDDPRFWADQLSSVPVLALTSTTAFTAWPAPLASSIVSH